MTPDADRIRQDYIERLRFNLKWASRDVSDEVVREIEAHIDDAWAAIGSPGVGDMLNVLDRLGPPELYARDLSLYMMVDRGYRQWSVPHMLRSTTVWAYSTLAGATVVSIFGTLFAAAGLLASVGVAGLLGLVAIPGETTVGRGALAWGLLAAGVIVLVGLVTTVRWFVGQYVRSAGPGVAFSEAEAKHPDDWVGQTSQRILVLAGIGFAAAALGAIVAGALSIDQPERLLSLEAFRSPAGVFALAGVLLLLAAPVVGLVWSLWADRAAVEP